MIKLRDTRRWRDRRADAAGLGAGPGGVREQYDTQNPSTYGENQLRAGRTLNESSSTRRTGDPPHPEPELEGVRRATSGPAYLDDITIQEGFADTVSAGKKVLTGIR